MLSASVTAERISPSADLLSAWLSDRLHCQVRRGSSEGPGITSVVLTTRKGDVTISRPDGRLATLSSPGAPDRPVALKRRGLDELLSEELRRLDPDDVYAATAKHLVTMTEERTTARKSSQRSGSQATGSQKTGSQKTGARRTASGKSAAGRG